MTRLCTCRTSPPFSSCCIPADLPPTFRGYRLDWLFFFLFHVQLNRISFPLFFLFFVFVCLYFYQYYYYVVGEREKTVACMLMKSSTIMIHRRLYCVTTTKALKFKQFAYDVHQIWNKCNNYTDSDVLNNRSTVFTAYGYFHPSSYLNYTSRNNPHVKFIFKFLFYIMFFCFDFHIWWCMCRDIELVGFNFWTLTSSSWQHLPPFFCVCTILSLYTHTPADALYYTLPSADKFIHTEMIEYNKYLSYIYYIAPPLLKASISFFLFFISVCVIQLLLLLHIPKELLSIATS